MTAFRELFSEQVQQSYVVCLASKAFRLSVETVAMPFHARSWQESFSASFQLKSPGKKISRKNSLTKIAKKVIIFYLHSYKSQIPIASGGFTSAKV
ncbi:MAG: hypothetical protein ACREOI_10400 [bacterium]